MPLREMLLIAILTVVVPASVFFPRVGVMAYMWFALLRPDLLAFAPNRPYSMILAIAALIGCSRVLVVQVHRALVNPISRMLVIFVVLTTLSVVFAVNVDLAYQPFPAYLRIILMALLIPVICTTVNDVRLLVIVAAMSLGFLGSKFGYFGFLHGGVRYGQAYGGFLGDNNSFALAMAMAIPFCLAARILVKQFWLKSLLVAMAIGCIGSIVWSHSRTGFLSLAVALGLMILRSRGRLLMLAVVPLAVGAAMFLAGDVYLQRMSTIKDYEEDNSAMSRIVYAKAAIRMWQDYPVFGVGFGSQNWVALSPKYLGEDDYHVVHNTYVQILVDSGLGTFIVYLILFFGTILRLEISIRGIRKIQPELDVIPKALQTSLLSFAVGSTFLSLVKFDILYFFLMISAAWWQVYQDLSSKKEALLAPALPQTVPRAREMAGSTTIKRLQLKPPSV